MNILMQSTSFLLNHDEVAKYAFNRVFPAIVCIVIQLFIASFGS